MKIEFDNEEAYYVAPKLTGNTKARAESKEEN